MKKNGFTLSEVLIVVAIIGVVAAMVLPPLVKNIKQKDYATARRKALYSIGGAVNALTANGMMTYAENSQDFVENYLKKQLKILKTCDYSNLSACGMEINRIKAADGTVVTIPETMRGLTGYGFVMVNGYAVYLFYNPACSTAFNPNFNVKDNVCVNAIYDMNGLSGPNEVGLDIGFVTAVYPDTSQVVHAPDIKGINWSGGCSERMDVLIPVWYNLSLIGSSLVAQANLYPSNLYNDTQQLHIQVSSGVLVTGTGGSGTSRDSLICIPD